ncbi:uncharacterized protein F5147DRAFT_658914 [Suillus discolor]|uniref:KOW domain-containing protein n=1 Tax=Suillus discolor TaxID=1912936 RepID=A0A9P7JLU0_9AGAM|nr:uncharacterized protein F5147DRAFT_658914 [Suillus discolor]KAG2087625.1 hypothetical protein F5147DRAFT_658914 [Suillus discolor]
MSKRAASSGDEPTAKRHCRISKVNQTGQSALYDNGAWEILKQFLMTSMLLSEMDDSLVAYLGDRYSEDDWVEPRCLLFSGDADNNESLRVLMALWRMYIPDPSKKLSVHTSASSPDNHLSGSRIKKLHRSYKRKNMYILDEAKEDNEEEEYEEGDGDGDGMSVQLPKVTRMQGPLLKQRLAATFDDMARTVTEHVADYLRRKNFLVTLSAWVVGQIYVVADSPKTIADSLHNSLYAGIKKYSRITDKERGAVERSQTTLPNPVWLELLTSPHVDDIQLHLESRWDKPFLRKAVMAFAMQFLHVGDHARVIKGSLSGELGKVISTDHTYGSVCLEFTFHECPEEIEVRLQDVERVFWVSDSVRVIAGPYLGLEGHILQKAEDVFHVCQVATKEVSHTPFKPTSATTLRASPDSNLIEIGDFIQVLDREHTGKHGVIDWLSKGDSYLWFRDLFTPVDTKSGLSSSSVHIVMVQQTDLTWTIQYTKERGYNVKPGDTVSVARGPEYGAKGVIQSMDFPNTCLTLLCDSDCLLIDVQIRFVIKLHNHHTTVKLHDVVTRYGTRLSARSITPPVEITPSGSSTSITDLSLSSSNRWASWSASPGDVDMMHDPASSINPSSSTSDPMT